MNDTPETTDRFSFTIRCGNMVVARVEGPYEEAEREAYRYAALYEAEGPVKIVRRPLRHKPLTKAEERNLLRSIMQ